MNGRLVERILGHFKFRPVEPVVEEIKPSRRDRRRIAKMHSAERQAKFLEAALRKQRRKRARGYDRQHVRRREVYAAGVNAGIDATIRAMTNRLKKNERRRWLPRIVSRSPEALARTRA